METILNASNGTDTKITHPRRYLKRILLVEDDPQWQKLISYAVKLTDLDLQLRVVRSAKAAQHLLYRDSNFDLIIADHYLEGEDTGMELWQICQQQHRKIPFVLISAIDQQVISEFLGEGMRAPLHLPKPIDLQTLQKVIRAKIGCGLGNSFR